ncbi:MAG: FRG domain-containing protein [Cytophagia bacterium]|nr:FRG domain-containing protein [Cytophagia bacterium]
MKSITINATQDLLDHFKELRNSTSFRFRGQSRENWDLVPKAGRPPFVDRNDHEIFRNWKRRAKGLIGINHDSDMDLLTIAQHYGLATRLLDWSLNPLVATYFACVDNFDYNGQLFIYKSSVTSSDQFKTPFKTDTQSIKMIQPVGTNSRLNNQLGYFTLHNPPNLPLKSSHLYDIIIPSNLKQEIIYMLNQYGVNNLSIFPDIEGLTQHLNWFYSNYEYWTK